VTRPVVSVPRRVAVVGAGWAGLAAAVEAVSAGHAVTLFEMAAFPGGRAREVRVGERVLDNGQHILIGAYGETLRLMRQVGVDEADVLLRTPLRIGDASGRGLYLRAGPAVPALVAAVARRGGWGWRDRVSLLAAAAGWRLRGFRCDPALDVAALTRSITPRVRADLIDPLCVAALNTPSSQASAAVFLRVLRDALFAGPGSADLLLPRASLSALFPLPAWRWLERSGAMLHVSRRVQSLAQDGAAWRVDSERFDHVVLATPPGEAARLAEPIAPDWSATAGALGYEPIVTVYARSPGTRLPEAMLALHDDENAPAQFVFDRGQLGGEAGLLAFVVSGAAPWVERGIEATTLATLSQARAQLQPHLRGPLEPVQTLTEKRATFRCTPGLRRPAMSIAPGLWAVGDHVDGPYPATLEGAVRSAVSAVRLLQ
jgi:squalene-associated FAD-dependent desaturase